MEATGPKTLRIQSHDMHGNLAGSKVTLSGYGDLSGPFEVKDWNPKDKHFDIALPDPSALEGVPLTTHGSWAKDTPFTSVPQSMWWSIVTLTTVGYGDMYPVTVFGRIVAAFTMLLGLALFGMLMNIVGKAMMAALFGSEDLDKNDPAPVENTMPLAWNPTWLHCPTCGHHHPPQTQAIAAPAVAQLE
jgi:hypothetical protein